MILRANPSLDRDAIARLKESVLDRFQEHTEDLLDEVGAAPTVHPLDEPVNVAARMAGISCLARSRLDACATEEMAEVGVAMARRVHGYDSPLDIKQKRRLGRAVLQAVEDGASQAEGRFLIHAGARSAPHEAFKLDEGTPLSATPDPPGLDLTGLKNMKVGERICDGFLVLLSSNEIQQEIAQPPNGSPGVETAVLRAPVFPEPLMQTPPKPLLNAEKKFSEFWPIFSEFQVSGKFWKHDEAIKSAFLVTLVTGLIGDRPIGAYSAQDMYRLREDYRKLPSKYAQAKPWRSHYERGGPRAVLAAAQAEKYDGPRISDKTWGRVFSTLSPMFEFAKTQLGAALPPSEPNPMLGLFIKPSGGELEASENRADWRLFKASELATVFSSPKFLGSASQSRWRQSGKLVFRDARYWLTLIAFLHGSRREEPVVLKVKHVKKCPETGIWYFAWSASTLRPLLKDRGSPRDVPLHRHLLALGFIEARIEGRDGEEKLFPDIGSDARICRHAGPFGQWFHRLLESCGLGDLSRDVHAARHTVVVELERRDVTDAWIEAIIGHESDRRRSTLASYKHARRLEELKARIDLIDFPIDVERLVAAVRHSDQIDRSAAWPDLHKERKWRKAARTIP